MQKSSVGRELQAKRKLLDTDEDDIAAGLVTKQLTAAMAPYQQTIDAAITQRNSCRDDEFKNNLMSLLEGLAPFLRPGAEPNG